MLNFYRICNCANLIRTFQVPLQENKNKRLTAVRRSTILSRHYRQITKFTSLNIHKELSDQLSYIIYPHRINSLVLLLKVPSLLLKSGNNAGKFLSVLYYSQQRMSVHFCLFFNIYQPRTLISTWSRYPLNLHLYD